MLRQANRKRHLFFPLLCSSKKQAPNSHQPLGSVSLEGDLMWGVGLQGGGGAGLTLPKGAVAGCTLGGC